MWRTVGHIRAEEVSIELVCYDIAKKDNLFGNSIINHSESKYLSEKKLEIVTIRSC